MKLMLQVGLVFGICFLGQLTSAISDEKVPGSVISLLLLFFLLATRVVRVDHIRQKSEFLLKNMAFFFVPAGVGVIAYFDLLRESLWALLAVIILTTILTFVSTALAVWGTMKLQSLLTRRQRRTRGRA